MIIVNPNGLSCLSQSHYSHMTYSFLLYTEHNKINVSSSYKHSYNKIISNRLSQFG